jgi:hypothetical protein
MMMMIIIIIKIKAFSPKDSLTRNITHHKESVTISDLKPEWWGLLLAQEEMYQRNENL